MTKQLAALDKSVNRWVQANAMHVLRIGLGIIFLWFGALKFVPGLSPAEGLVRKTVCWAVDPAWFLPTLAAWECAIGVGLLWGRHLNVTLALMAFHMGGTFMPLVACPDEVWQHFPYAWTLEGQYILKNLVIIGAGLALVAHLRATPCPDSESGRVDAGENKLPREIHAGRAATDG